MKTRYIFLIISFLFACPLSSQAQEEKNFPTYEITIKSANGLSETDLGKKNKTDPYAILYVLEKTGNDHYLLREIARTKVVQDTNDPRWDYTTKFTPRNPHEMTEKFMIRAVDEDKKMPRDVAVGHFGFQYTRDVDDKIIQNGTDTKHILNIAEGYRRLPAHDVLNRMPFQVIRPGTVTISIKKIHHDVTVANFIGQKWDQVQPRIQNDNSLNWAYKAQISTDENKDGVILSQSPAPGTSVKHGSTIGVKVGKIQKINVPHFINMRLPDMHLRMRSLNLKLGNQTYRETPNPRLHGRIADQSPAPGR